VSRTPEPTFYEFFAGGGMARTGLGAGWRCLFANDFDPVKAAAYRANFADAGDHFREGDVFALEAADLPGRADLAWASSPCQDFSLAGARAGLAGGRSSAFYGFWRLMEALGGEGRAPKVIVVENVVGLLTANGGRDFAALCDALCGAGYRVGALEIDASGFLPQSRPRVFVVAARETSGLTGPSPYHTRAVHEAHALLPEAVKAQWAWWRLEAPARRNADLADLLESDAVVLWRSEAETRALLAMMDDKHRARVDALAAAPGRSVGAVFRRMRGGVQRAEARFDGMAGCLRTPRGGSSRQLLLVVGDGQARSRWLTAREAARLMGLSDAYVLPKAQTNGLFIAGDGVAVPVVRHLAERLLEPLMSASTSFVAAE